LLLPRAEDLPEGGADPDSIRHLIRQHRPALVAVTWVPTSSGLVQPVEAIGEVCEAAGVPYLVDACQAVGQLGVDVGRLRCDFLAATARKFLRGPRGIGFLYVSDRALRRGLAPLYIDMRGARWVEAGEYALAGDASRFENWEFAYALLLGMGAAAAYALDVGVEDAGRRAAELAAYCRTGLRGIDGVRVLDRGSRLCAIVTAEVRGFDAAVVVSRLREEAINTSATRREFAVLDMDAKGAASAIRISPHYYNTRREIELVVGAIEALVVDA
jgi:selenocysteine lyase/cysteine desulfurase